MKLYNIVKVYTSTVGTGTVTLGSAVPSFITFATAGVVNGSTVSYAIEDGNNREVGTGTYTSGAETLTRSVVTSTNSNNLITLSGNAVVFITGLAADLSSDTANVASTLIQRDGSGNFAAGAATLSSAVMKGSSSGSTTVQASATASGTLTLPAATDTLIGKATSDTLTNKTFDTAGAGNVLRINGTQVSAVTGTGSVVLATSPTLVTPLLGTPTSGTLTNCTGLPVSTGISGLGANVATFLATPSSANLASAVTDETGTGALVFANTPTLVTPVLGTPTSGTLTNCTGLPVSTGVSGLGSGVATFLATPSSANLAAAVTDETGTGALVFGTSPTIATPTITTSATVPLVIGGTGTTSTLTLRSTSGVGTTGADIIFQTGNNGATEVMRLQNGGNVGIGTSSPGEKLVVVGNIVAGNTGTTADGYIDIDGGATGKVRISRTGTGATASGMVFYTQFSTLQERMRILSTGEVGIGTSSPAGKLDIVTGVYRGYFDDAAGSLFRLSAVNAANSAYGPLSVNGSVITFQISASEKMRLDSNGNLLVGTTSALARLTVSAGTAAGAVANITSGQTGTTVRSNSVFRIQSEATGRDVHIQFSDNVTNATEIGMISGSTYFCTGAAERMRIDSSGNVGIRTSSPATSAALEIAGTTGALLVPRLTTTERNALTAVNGMIIYNTTDNEMQGRINGAWVAL